MPLFRLQRRRSTPARRALHPGYTAFAVTAVITLLVVTSACSTYTDRMRDAQMAFATGDVEGAIGEVNTELEVQQIDEAPRDLGDENTLFLLERATMLQALGQYDSAARDMITVDDRLEWVDIQSDRADTVLRFIYSDAAGPYGAPAHERLVLNAMNMINFMAQGQHSSARVEARRFDLMQRYFLDDQSADIIGDILGMGHYLAGAAFEADGQFRAAARFYTAAYLHGTWPEDGDRLLDLVAMTGYRGSGLGELPDRAYALFDRAGKREAMSRGEYRETYLRGDTLIVIQTGLVPYLEPERVGLNRAIETAMASPYGSVHLDSETRRTALSLEAAGTLTWLNTATLTSSGIPTRRRVTLAAGDRNLALSSPIDLATQVEKAWEAVAGTALAAAITRAVARLAAGQGARAVAEEAASQTGRSDESSRAIGWLAGLATQTTLAARDRPDTRSWTTLPSDVHFVRLQLSEGDQPLEVRVNGRTDRRNVDIRPDSFQLFNFSRLR